MINLLPKNIINQIAAGEVVERPASIVKELVENSIDAGATEIKIEILDAGATEIIIQDNGSRIDKDDFENLFKRHATSKIEKIEDLHSLSTMGFRGEALSSIQAVSQVELITKTESDITGYFYNPHTAEIKPIAKSNAGTTITIRNLFYNVPARKKFLKSNATELSHITKIIEEIALVNPDIAFIYKSQNRELINVKASDLLTRTVNILKVQEPEYLLELNSQKHNLKAIGYIGHPRISKKSPQYHIFINNRPVIQPLINKAIQQGFDTMLEVGHYPFAFVSIFIPQQELDVNVHPRKTEVKFTDDRAIFQTIKYLIKDTLQQSAFEVVLKPQNSKTEQSEINLSHTNINTKNYNFKPYNQTYNSNTKSTIAEPNFAQYAPKQTQKAQYNFQNIQPNFRELLEAETEKPNFLHIFDTYIMYPNQKGIMVLDQHAVHEKVILEQLINQADTVKSQALLFPLAISVPQSQKDFTIEVLSQLPGFEVDDFGASEIIIRALPTFLAKTQKAEEHINTLIAQIQDRGQTIDLSELKIELLKTVACKSAIKAGYSMTKSEIEALIKDAAKTDFGFACCHGRPTMVQLDQDWFEKQFSR
jgi:DNA mismatch repair protein MutL